MVRGPLTAAAAALLFLAPFGCGERITGPRDPALRVSGDASASRNDGPFAPGLATTRWGVLSRALVVQQRMSPTTAARAYALLAIAQYGAVVAADEAADDGTLGNGFGEGGRSRYEARRGAVAGASAAMLTYLFPGAEALVEQRVLDEGAAGPGGVHPHFTRGETIGRALGARVVAWGRTDGFDIPWTGTIPTGPGLWRGTTVAAAQHAFMRPIVLTSPRQFRAPAPPEFGGTVFTGALQDVLRMSTTERTSAQLQMALDRNLSSGTITGLGFFIELATTYIVARGLDELAAAHVLAVMNAAASDAVIGCWDSKLAYFYIRPSQAIQGIALAFGVPGHPSYPSGHSCLSGSAATVLASYFPERAAELDVHVRENGLSRIYAGIHYGFDVTAGQDLGRAVGAAALAFDRDHGVLAALPPGAPQP